MSQDRIAQLRAERDRLEAEMGRLPARVPAPSGSPIPMRPNPALTRLFQELNAVRDELKALGAIGG